MRIKAKHTRLGNERSEQGAKMEKETHEDAIDRAACQVHLGAYDYDALEAAYLECEEAECQWCSDWEAARKDLESLASCGMDFCECRGTS